MEAIVGGRVQGRIDLALGIPRVVGTILGFLPKEEVFANRRVAKVWREAGFWALCSKGYAYKLPEQPVQEDFEQFENKFSKECNIPLDSAVVGNGDSVIALSKDYSKFVVRLSIQKIPVGFQFQWSELGEFPRLKCLSILTIPLLQLPQNEQGEEEHCVYYPKTDPTAKFLSKLARSNYFKSFNAVVFTRSGRDVGDLPLELTILSAGICLPIPEQSCLLTTLPNLKILAIAIYHYNDEEGREPPRTDLQDVNRVKSILEKFSPHLEIFGLCLDQKYLHLFPFLRMPRMEKLRELALSKLPIESADASPLPQVLPELESLFLDGERPVVFGNMAAFGHGENRRLEELRLGFQAVEHEGNWEAFPQLILNFKALKSLHIFFIAPEDSLHISPDLFGAFMDIPSLNKLRLKGNIEVDPALIETWANAGREIEMEP